jgi:hypothetical protein
VLQQISPEPVDAEGHSRRTAPHPGPYSVHVENVDSDPSIQPPPKELSNSRQLSNTRTRIYAMPWTVNSMRVGSTVMWVNAELADLQDPSQKLAFGDVLKIVGFAPNGMAVCEQLSVHGSSPTQPSVGTIVSRAQNTSEASQVPTGLSRTLTWSRRIRDTVRHNSSRRPEVKAESFKQEEKTARVPSPRPNIEVQLLGCVSLEDFATFCERAKVGRRVLPVSPSMSTLEVMTDLDLNVAIDRPERLSNSHNHLPERATNRIGSFFNGRSRSPKSLSGISRSISPLLFSLIRSYSRELIASKSALTSYSLQTDSLVS